jgi:hypothetical protein
MYGIATGCQGMTSNDSTYVRVTVDGTVVCDCLFNVGQISFPLPAVLPFKTSLLVEQKSSSGRAIRNVFNVQLD